VRRVAPKAWRPFMRAPIPAFSYASTASLQ
jgi:hypothetical protein